MNDSKELKKRLDDFFEITAMKGPRDLSFHSIYSFFNDYLLWRYIFITMMQYGKANLSELKILDAGCANARALQTFWQWGADPQKCYGVDGSEGIIEVAKELFPQFQLTAGLIDDLSYEDDFFDVSVCLGVFNHILDNHSVSDILKELSRTMKPGGLLYVTLPNENVMYPDHLKDSLRVFNFNNREFELLAESYFEVLNVHQISLDNYQQQTLNLDSFAMFENYLKRSDAVKTVAVVLLRKPDQ